MRCVRKACKSSDVCRTSLLKCVQPNEFGDARVSPFQTKVRAVLAIARLQNIKDVLKPQQAELVAGPKNWTFATVVSLFGFI